ncbi:hypothetical protein PPACK8108_LOCUS5541 [Phakopsora pachyrhizi]|uniref:Capsid protein n=1 Tax=Phakopsora pachyrhizi TaxID=170000 RepID=A0AAV0ARZ8_PHAPC|nr:hypothetical protein PPACK8108_LOCUS5541 [Phakopsora pachyrhizi]
MPTKEQLTRVTTDTKIPKADRNRLGQAAQAGSGRIITGPTKQGNKRANKSKYRCISKPKKNIVGRWVGGGVSVGLVRRRETPRWRRTDIRYIGKAVVERQSDRTVGRRARRRHTVVRSSYHFRVGAKVPTTSRELFNEPLIPVKLSHWAWTVPDTSAKGIVAPKYGMFIHDEQTNQIWFYPASTEFEEFKLSGKLWIERGGLLVEKLINMAKGKLERELRGQLTYDYQQEQRSRHEYVSGMESPTNLNRSKPTNSSLKPGLNVKQLLKFVDSSIWKDEYQEKTLFDKVKTDPTKTNAIFSAWWELLNLRN